MRDGISRRGSSGAAVCLVLAATLGMIASTRSIVPAPEDFQLAEYAWIKEDGRGAEYWWQHNDTGPNVLALTYRFSRCNIAYVARSTASAEEFNVTFIIFHNSSTASGFEPTGHLFPGSQPNWSLTVPAQHTHTAGQNVYHLFITTFDPQGVSGFYQVRINETGPGSGSDWNSPAGNPTVQWMFFMLPTSMPQVQVRDSINRSQPFFVDGILPSSQLNASIYLNPPGNSTGASSATVVWFNPGGAAIMTRSSAVEYRPGTGWFAEDIVALNITAFPPNGTGLYSVEITVGYFKGVASFRVLSSQWIDVSLEVTPTKGQWFDPSSFSVTYTAVIDTGVPENPYADVSNLTIQFRNATGMVGVLANLSWNITPYAVIPGSSYTYSWNGLIPASWIDSSEGAREFYGIYSLRSVPSPGAETATATQVEFFVDDPLEAYTSNEKAGVGRSAFKAGSTVWINVELDPTYLRSPAHGNSEYTNRDVEVTWYWVSPPPDYVKKHTVQATKEGPRPSDQFWAFSTLNTSTSDPDGIYAIGASVLCNTGYRVWEYKYYDIYQSYTPPTEAINRAPYSTHRTFPQSPTPWHLNQTTIKINSADPPPGSGVETIFCQIDNGGVFTGTPSTEEFTALEGSHLYTYWAIDWAGNAEVPNTAMIMVDTRDPQTTLTLINGTGPLEGMVIVRLNAQDPSPG